MGGTTGTIDNESRISSELSRGEVEKWDVDGSCMGWYPYVNGHVDMEGNSECLSMRAIAEAELAVMVVASRRVASWYCRMRKACCAALATRALLSAAVPWPEQLRLGRWRLLFPPSPSSSV